MDWKKYIKLALGIKKSENLSLKAFLRSWHRRIGPLYYKQKYDVEDVVEAMKRAGMHRGSTILIQSSWGEFYNCSGKPNDLIKALLDVLGPEGTLCMPCMPKMKNGEVFDVVNTPTRAGYLPECFRTYPGVKRSVHVQHSVCAIGANADFLLSEHQLGETPWDEHSPYYRLSQVGGIVFGLGLGTHWVGTITHCVESILRGKVEYYTDMWDMEKKRFDYIDYDGKQKSYFNYDRPTNGRHKRLTSYFKSRHIVSHYLHNHYQQISNLQICCFEAQEVVSVMTELAKRGIDIYFLPLKWGYKFDS